MIGILPAAGEAKRMHGIPKYLLPEKNGYLLKRHLEQIAPFCVRIDVLANPINYKILEGMGSLEPNDDEKLVWLRNVGFTETMSQTVLHVKDYLYNQDVLFGMPDTYIEDSIFPPNHDLLATNIYHRMAMKLHEGADLVVGVFPAREDQKSHVGMVALQSAENGYTVVECVDKPATTDLHYGWGTLAWKPVFWQFIKPEDPHVGYAIPRAIEAGLDIRTATMHSYWDCGTPDEYFALIRHLTEER